MKIPATLMPFLMPFLLLLLATAAWAEEEEDESTLCPCLFNGNDDEDCRVYGQLGDDILIPWHLASQDCLDAHNIKLKRSAIPPFTLSGMCDPPNANAFVNYLANAFVNYLKFESIEASTSIKQRYGDFWNANDNPVTLVSNINGVDCDADANGCWDEIKAYFEANSDEIQDNCQTFYNAAAKHLGTEQLAVRISICNREIVAAEECGALQTQVEEIQAANPNKSCPAFGLGPVSGGPEKPPVCSNGNSNTESGTASSGAHVPFNKCIWNGMLATVLLAKMMAF